MTPTERLAARFEKKDETRKKYKCGKCASCYQLEACPVDHLEDPFVPTISRRSRRGTSEPTYTEKPWKSSRNRAMRMHRFTE